jgi:hypothetical protein
LFALYCIWIECWLQWTLVISYEYVLNVVYSSIFYLLLNGINFFYCFPTIAWYKFLVLFSKTFDIAAILLPTIFHWLFSITEAGSFWKFPCQSGIKRPKTILDSLSSHLQRSKLNNQLHCLVTTIWTTQLQPSRLASRAWAIRGAPLVVSEPHSAMCYSLFHYYSFVAGRYPILTT